MSNADTIELGKRIGDDTRPRKVHIYPGHVLNNIEDLKNGWVRKDGILVKDNSIKRIIIPGKTLFEYRASSPHNNNPDIDLVKVLKDDYIRVFVGYVQNPDVKDEFMLINDDNSVFKDLIMNLTSETKLNDNGKLPLGRDVFYDIKSKGYTMDIPRTVVNGLKNNDPMYDCFKFAIIDFMSKGDEKVRDNYVGIFPGKLEKVLRDNFQVYFTESQGAGLVSVISVGYNSDIDCNSSLSNDNGLLPGVSVGDAKK